MKRFNQIFIALLLALTLISPVYAETFIHVTLRIEGYDQTIYQKKEVQVENKENLTPQDVLSAAKIQYSNNEYGSVGSIQGIEDMWCYAVNNDSTIYPPVISDNDDLVYYLYNYDNGNGRYVFFKEEEYTTSTDKPLKIQLMQENVSYTDTMKREEIGKGNIEILYKKEGEAKYSSTYQKTDENGYITLDFDEQGVYEITTKSLNTSRAYAKINVTQGQENPYKSINKTIQSLNIPSAIDSNISLLEYTPDYTQTLTWTSSKPEVLSEKGIVHRQKEDVEVELIAVVSDGKNSKKVSFQVKVLKDDSQYDAGTIQNKNAIWSNIGHNQAITNSQTAISSQDVKLKWKASDIVSTPIIVDQYIYALNSQNQLVRLDKNGKVLKSVDLSSSLYYTPSLCYGDGMIFVPLSSGTIQAFNEDNLSSLWISEELKGAIASRLTYFNGYIYAGTYGSSKGCQFVGIDVKDEDKTKGDEVKKIKWSYQSKGRDGFYNNQAIVIFNQLYFIGDEGKLVVHSLTQDKVIKSIELDSSVRGGMTYDDNYLYIMTTSSTLYKISIKDLKVINKVQIYSNGTSTCSPTLYNNRLYIGGSQNRDDFYAKGFIAVVDVNTMKIIDKVSTKADVKGQPLVSQAYTKKENKNSVVVYFTQNIIPGGVYCFEDYEGNEKINMKDLYIPKGQYQNYNMDGVCVDEDGTLYFRNDSHTLFALSNANKGASIDMDIKEERHPKENQQSQNQKKKNKKSVITETGDETQISNYIIIIIVAIIALIILLLPVFKKCKVKK